MSHLINLQPVQLPYKPSVRGMVHPEELQETVTVPPKYAVPEEVVIEIGSAWAQVKRERRAATVASLPGAACRFVENAHWRASSGSSRSSDSSTVEPQHGGLCCGGGAPRPAGGVEAKAHSKKKRVPFGVAMALRGTVKTAVAELVRTA